MNPTCSNCTMANNEGATFCRHCGAQMSAPPMAAALPPPPPQASYGAYPSAPPPQAPYGSYPSAPLPPPPPQASYGSYPSAPLPPPPPPPPPPPQASYGSYPSAPLPPAQWPGHPQSAPAPPPVPNSYQSVYQQPSYPPASPVPPGAYAQPGAGYGYAQPVPASAIARWAAHFIDGLPLIIVMPFTFIPILGAIVTILIVFPYWLLRDISGGGIGKRLLGLEIIQVDGTPPRQGPRVLRNITLAAPWVCTIIPGIGHALFAVLALFVYVTELVLVLAGNRRLGDRLAGTMVVQKRS